jgi:hypothetical protein
MITITRNEVDLEVTDDEVIHIVQLAILQHFDIGLSILKDKSRDSMSSHPRKLYWYFLKYQYGLKNNQIKTIDDSEFDSSAVTIQSEIVLLQQHYNKKLREEVEVIRQLLILKEDNLFKIKLAV